MPSSPLNKCLELLAPARDLVCAKSAILSGADAIYIGGPAFGARAAAKNSLDDLKKICEFAHLFGVKVHVTFNTLLYDDELSYAQELIYGINDCEADALIIQDPALFSLDIPKTLALHASTQCNIDCVEELLYFKSRGVTQVVLPREFTLSDIQKFHEAAPDLKLEAFILGALCVGVSGVCHISDYLKGRSANRGECAQICRLPMQLFKHEHEIAVGHLLSLKDNNLVPHLEELIRAGVTSFKIEGRLKDEDYVINTTSFAHAALCEFTKKNSDYVRASYANDGTLDYTLNLEKTFNRGFTDGLLLDNKDALNCDVTPKFMGEKFGKILDYHKVFKGTEIVLKTFGDNEPHNGDGLTYFKKQMSGDAHNPHIAERILSVDGFRVSKVQTAKGRTYTILVQGNLEFEKGSILYRNYDKDYLTVLLSRTLNARTLPYALNLRITSENRNVTLILEAVSSYKKKVALSCTFPYDEKAEAIGYDKLLQTLGKKINGYTKFTGLNIEGELSRLTLKVSLLNALRRDVLEKFFSYEREERSFMPLGSKAAMTPIPFMVVDKRVVLNAKAREFYGRTGAKIVDANFADVRSPDLIKLGAVLKSRFCLIRKYACCSREGGKVTGYTLRVSGKNFKIMCDCQNCFMYLVAN